jgi:hypothetical protein
VPLDVVHAGLMQDGKRKLPCIVERLCCFT